MINDLFTGLLVFCVLWTVFYHMIAKIRTRLASTKNDDSKGMKSLGNAALGMVIALFGTLYGCSSEAHEADPANNLHRVEITRWKDPDTFVANIYLGYDVVLINQVVRLYCVNAPESGGRNKSPEGVELKAQVFARGITSGYVRNPPDPKKHKDSLGRWLQFFWDDLGAPSFNQWLVDQGSPLYHRLTRAERAVCEAELIK